ncbi:MAG: hypothetical protein P4M13_04390, partial [Alphaproteobacteria bacterium]|nr:hypothetical protein [Alphaproteobacteria bacterium]
IDATNSSARRNVTTLTVVLGACGKEVHRPLRMFPGSGTGTPRRCWEVELSPAALFGRRRRTEKVGGTPAVAPAAAAAVAPAVAKILYPSLNSWKNSVSFLNNDQNTGLTKFKGSFE